MILAVVFGFLVGIFLGSFTAVTVAGGSALALVAAAFFMYRNRVPERRTMLLCITVFVCGVLLGLGRITVSDAYRSSHLDAFVGERITARGIVVDEPDVREHNVKLTVRLSSIVPATTTIPVHEKILITVPLYPRFSYGDEISLAVILAAPKDIESEDGRVFDYSGYLRVRGIWYVSRFAQATLISSGHGSAVKRGLFALKGAFTERIERALPPPESSLMSGLLLGAKQSLGKDLLDQFSRAGVSHVVVLSGYNIAIVAESIMALLAFLPGTLAFGFGCFSIILFTVLSGGGASAVRAAIMVLVALWARRSGRQYRVERAFGLTVVVMLLWNPLLLVFDPSFQLSVLATIGLIFVSPIFSPLLGRVTERWNLREIISSTLSTQLIVLPFLLYTTGRLSLVALPVNILILGTVPLTMLLGFITGIVGFVSLYLSFVPAFGAYVLLWYQLTVVHLSAALPFGAVSIPAFSPFVLVCVYACIAIGLYLFKHKTAEQSVPLGDSDLYTILDAEGREI